MDGGTIRYSGVRLTSEPMCEGGRRGDGETDGIMPRALPQILICSWPSALNIHTAKTILVLEGEPSRPQHGPATCTVIFTLYLIVQYLLVVLFINILLYSISRPIHQYLIVQY